MRTFLQKLIFGTLILGFLGGSYQPVRACDLSSLTLDSVTPAPGGTFYLYLRLCVGAGVLGLLKGADGNTGRFLFSFSSSTPGFAVTSFTTPITSNFTGVPYNGVNVGAQPAFNATQAIFYNNSSNWFTCITSTVACGNVNQECDQVRFQVTSVPDSIRIYGIEGGDNLFGGCYPNISMLIDFTGLPVEWQDFTGRAAQGGVVLNWATGNEQNSHSFEILRSGDGVSFQSIGRIAASGQKVGQYEYFDPNPLAGTNHYRLRQVDGNGSSTESNVIAVHFVPQMGVSWESVSPNPADEWVNISFHSEQAEAMVMDLVDLQGRSVAEFKVNAQSGLNTIKASTSQLAPGMYFLRLRHSVGILEKKLVIM